MEDFIQIYDKIENFLNKENYYADIALTAGNVENINNEDINNEDINNEDIELIKEFILYAKSIGVIEEK